MPTTPTLDLIATDPAVRNGQPCIGGAGLCVTDLVMAHLFHRRTPDELAADYELSLAQVVLVGVVLRQQARPGYGDLHPDRQSARHEGTGW